LKFNVREEDGLKSFESGVLVRIFGHKAEEIT
jgi:hypothetical protein